MKEIVIARLLASISSMKTSFFWASFILPRIMARRTGDLEQRKLLWTLNSLVSQRTVKSEVSSSNMMVLVRAGMEASLLRDLGTSRPGLLLIQLSPVVLTFLWRVTVT